MPGITGIIGVGRTDERRAALCQMVQSIRHEPFYTSGEYVNEKLGVWLGWVSHKDSFSDGMPIWNEKKDICVIFAGEDYTDPEEIDRLRAIGHDFELGNASYSVHLYEEQGVDFITRLNGRFSGIIVDLRKQIIVLFNDRYGLNRIYCYENMSGFFFSSEAKTLLRALPELRRLDPLSLAEAFSCGCVLQNRTLFAGVSLVPGGSAWTFFPNQSKRTYFRQQVWEAQERLSASDY